MAYARHDYNAAGLFDKYVAWEKEHGSARHVAALYSSIMAAPLKELDRLHTR